MKYEFPTIGQAKKIDLPEDKKLGFGKIMAPWMSVATYTEGQGWHDLAVVPYGPFMIEPAASVLHYGQEMFEGLKAFRRPDGSIWTFRPDMNWKRIINTNKRLVMPEIPEEMFYESVRAGVLANEEYVPKSEGTSLYVRPFMIATEPFLGVHVSKEYKYFVIFSPVASYYAAGTKPVDLYVETVYSRAADGGTGFAKTSGNYAASLLSQVLAEQRGYAQVLWTDSSTHTYAEEIGTSNAFFIIDGTVITAPLNGTILPGITRDSVLTILRDWGIPVEERPIKIDEIFEASKAGKLDEMFATGTAAVVSPVGHLDRNGEIITIANNEIGPIAAKLYDAINAIRVGTAPDTHNWMVRLK